MTALIAIVTADDRLFQRASDVLGERGWRVVRAGDGTTPVAAEPRPDLVLLDADLPEVDASTVLARLDRGQAPRPLVLVLADRSRAEAALAALRAGADDVLFKPLDPFGFTARVEGLLCRASAQTVRERVQTLEFRTQELESFIYIVTHDMKTPVVNLQGLVSLIEQDHASDLPKPVADYLARLRRNAERLEQLLHDLLEYPRRLRVVGPLEPHPVGPVVQAAADGLLELARARGVEVAIAPDLPTASCDPKRLQQVFHNLLENAIKHSAAAPGARVEVGWARTSEGPRFHVRDNGPGIPKDQVNDVFKLFHRVPGTASDGTGIGLAVARQLVEAHGGEIWCESTPGEGACFYFRLASGP
jgi:signal transduction histidine kinase